MASIFPELPDVLIQHPRIDRSYLIPASALRQHQSGPDDLLRIGPDTVTFVIPDEEFIEEVPPFLRIPTDSPSVLIQYPTGRQAFYLTSAQLATYTVDQPRERGVGYGISFIIPLD